MYNEMAKHGTLTRGSIELQYSSHLKAMASIRRQELARKQGIATREALRGTTITSTAASGGTTTATTTTGGASVKVDGKENVLE